MLSGKWYEKPYKGLGVLGSQIQAFAYCRFIQSMV